MQNRFKPYNKSMLVNVLMSNNYKYTYYIPMYNKINKKNYYKRTVLTYTCENNIINITRFLLSHPDIDVNAKDKYENTALIYACKYGGENMVRFLLSHPNINVNLVDLDGDTALHNSFLNNKINVVKLLLQHPKINISIKNVNGVSFAELLSSAKKLINLLKKYNVK